MRIVSANVNGIRAAARRGGLAALHAAHADVLCLQEVRATPAQLAATLAGSELADWDVAVDPGPRAGHAGVAILCPAGRMEQVDPLPGWQGQGRWLEVLMTPTPGGGRIRVATTYVPTGAGGDAAELHKKDFLAAIGDWLGAHAGQDALLAGDLNVAHTRADLRAWRANQASPGFLPRERAHLTRWFAPPPDGLGWVDLGRALGGEGPGPYTWWSWRGRAFDNDAGWRIDYCLASPALAPRARSVAVGRAGAYDQRWSDHAPVLVDLD